MRFDGYRLPVIAWIDRLDGFGGARLRYVRALDRLASCCRYVLAAASWIRLARLVEVPTQLRSNVAWETNVGSGADGREGVPEDLQRRWGGRCVAVRQCKPSGSDPL